MCFLTPGHISALQLTTSLSVCLSVWWCRGLWGVPNSPSAREPASPSVCLPGSLQVFLSVSAWPTILLSCGRGWQDLDAAWRLKVRQRDTARCLMTHYNYTYSCPPAELRNAMERCCNVLNHNSSAGSSMITWTMVLLPLTQNDTRNAFIQIPLEAG